MPLNILYINWMFLSRIFFKILFGKFIPTTKVGAFFVIVVKAGPVSKIFAKQFIRKAEENKERIRKELLKIWKPENRKYNILLIFNEFLSFGKFEGIEEIIKKAKDSEIKTFLIFVLILKKKFMKKVSLKIILPAE